MGDSLKKGDSFNNWAKNLKRPWWKFWVSSKKAGAALAGSGPDAIPALAELLKSGSPRVRRDAVKALGKIGPSAVSALIESLKDKDWTVRAAVIRALNEVGSGARDAAPVLLRTLFSDNDGPVRAWAALALCNIGLKEEIVPALIDALKDKDWGVRRSVVQSLGTLGTAPNVVPALISALKDKNEVVCVNAAKALGEIGPDAFAAVPELTKLRDSPDIGPVDGFGRRQAAVEALKKIMGFIEQQKNTQKRVGTEKPKSELLEEERSKSGANNKTQRAPDKEGDRPGQFVGISEEMRKEPWMLETRTNEFGRLEARWGPRENDWLVQIPSSRIFTMGAVSHGEEPTDIFLAAAQYSETRHIVAIEKPFWLMKYPVTQEQYEKVTCVNPSCFTGEGNRPVERVSWEDAREFIERANKQYGTRFRLPSEAEWEYACRARTHTIYYWGDEMDWSFAWCKGNSSDKTHSVGQKKANGYGLYDMLGNVCEWVEDDWHDDYENAPENEKAWVDNPRGVYRIVRGGNWDNKLWYLRASCRGGYYPDTQYNSIGFRCAQD